MELASVLQVSCGGCCGGGEWEFVYCNNVLRALTPAEELASSIQKNKRFQI